MSMPDEPSSGGNVFMRKIGPWPMWAWMLVLLGVAIGARFLMKKKTGSSASSSDSSDSTTASTGGDSTVDSPGGVDSSLVPQFINQTYTQVTPPPAPSVTVNDTTNNSTTTTKTTGATTISGSPGSYTTKLGTGYDEWTSTGKYSINTLAKSHGMTAQQLIAASESQTNNPALKAYVSKKNLNAPLPSGIAVFIPTADWNKK